MEMASAHHPRALTIAGSDSGGGAGIQADLKTFAALGVFGTSAITAVTAQNTLGVTSVAEVPIEVISDQIDAVASDIGIDIVKTGMLSSSEIVECVADSLNRHRLSPIVVDPVMVAATGAVLLQQEAVRTVRDLMLPAATVITPNVPEAEELLGIEIDSVDDMADAARALLDLGAENAVVKGGHLRDGSGLITDVLANAEGVERITVSRIDSTSNHGTGCTFASALASHLIHGKSVYEATMAAQSFVWNAMAAAYPIGSGSGPLNHMHEMGTESD